LLKKIEKEIIIAMSKNEKLVKEITRRDEDFAKWYTEICLKAELMDYSDLKGFIIYRPYGYAIWENIVNYLDNRFKETGHENVYMPMLIPESLFNKEKEHVEGFAPECAVVTIGGKEELAERLIIRPTSEVLFCEHFRKVVTSHRDLPKKYNQWCSVLRWEKTTRPFLRGKEFLWQEGHTVHKDREEAEKETLDMLKVYETMGSDLLAIPFVTGRKTESEKFAGAVDTYTIEALMHDKKALQSGTSHFFGDGFAKAFDIKYQDKENKPQHVFQTSWGVTTRLIGALIMVHSDDEGLVLPPYIAPTQVVIIPIMSHKPEVMKNSHKIYDKLKKSGIRVKLDDSDRTPGWKFSEYEMKGVPLRLEIGPRDIENKTCNIVLRHTKEKISLSLDNLHKEIPKLFVKMHQELYDRALKNVTDNTRAVNSYQEFKEVLNQHGGYIKMSLCDDPVCEKKIKEETQATARCIPFIEEQIKDVCPICGTSAKYKILFAKAY